MAPFTVMDLAARRKTARSFAKTPISLDDVLYSIKVAVQAPSGANKQPWRFILSTDAELRAKIRAACEEQEKHFHSSVEANLEEWFKSKNLTWQKPFLTDAPILVAVFSNRKMPYATESTWLMIGYFLLALEERLLSTVTYTPPYPEKLGCLFEAPANHRLETILPIGYSADSKPKERRQSFESLIYENVWNRNYPID